MSGDGHRWLVVIGLVGTFAAPWTVSAQMARPAIEYDRPVHNGVPARVPVSPEDLVRVPTVGTTYYELPVDLILAQLGCSVGAAHVSPDGQRALVDVYRPDPAANAVGKESWLVWINGSRAPRRLPITATITIGPTDGHDTYQSPAPGETGRVAYWRRYIEGGALGWTPDGRSVLLLRRSRTGAARLWSLDVETFSEHILTRLPLMPRDTRNVRWVYGGFTVLSEGAIGYRAMAETSAVISMRSRGIEVNTAWWPIKTSLLMPELAESWQDDYVYGESLQQPASANTWRVDPARGGYARTGGPVCVMPEMRGLQLTPVGLSMTIVASSVASRGDGTERADLAPGTIQWLDDLVPLPGGERFLVRRQTLVDPPELFVAARQTSGLVRLQPLLRAADVDPTWATRERGTIDTLSWLSGDNGAFRIHGLLLLPPQTQPPHTHPLIVYNPGGPGTVASQFEETTGLPAQAMAAAGYVVLFPNTRNRFYPSDSTQGHQVHAQEGSDVVHELQDDILPGIDVLVRRGLVDSTKIGIAGFSYGGGLTAYAITATNRFRAAEVGDPTGHLASAYARWGDALGRHEGRQLMGIDANIYDSAYRRRVLDPQEPIFNVGAVHTPTLTECGPYSGAAQPQCEWWFQGLRYMGVPSEFVVYPRSGHGWFEPALALDSFERNKSWFDYWLLNKPYRDRDRQLKYDQWKAHRAAGGDSWLVPQRVENEP